MLGISEPLWGALAAVTIALSGGVFGIHQKIHTRIQAIEKRVDGFELEASKQYITKEDFKDALGKIEQHMIRIEDKLDKIRDHA